MILASSNVDLAAAGPVILAVIGVASLVVAIWKARPERDALVISAKQGAAEILDKIVQAQDREITRKDVQIAQLTAVLEERDRVIAELRGGR